MRYLFCLSQTAQNIIEVGKRLIQAKSLVQHGHWQAWLEQNFQLSQMTANNFMNCAERFSNYSLMNNLKPTQLMTLLSLPAGEEKNFVEQMTNSGTPVEDMTVKKLKEEIAERFIRHSTKKGDSRTFGVEKMTDLIVAQNNLPASIEDLSKFVLVGDEKIKADRAQISALKKLGVAQEVVKIKLHEAQTMAEQVTFAKVKLGELLAALPKAKENQHTKVQIDTAVERQKTKAESIAELGITQKQAERLQVMAKNQEAVQSAMAKAREQKLREGQEIGKLVLLAEARLGELFNQMPKQQGTRTDLQPLPPTGKKLDDRSEVDKPKAKLEVAAEMGFNKNQVAQFQKLADNPDAVQKAIDDAKDNDEIVTRSKALENIKADDKKIPIQQNTGNNERYTPKEYIDAAREVLGTIDLDPASSELANETVKATKIYTADDDGLAQEWFGNIWLNPPYAKDLLPKFAEKFARDKSRCDMFTSAFHFVKRLKSRVLTR